MWLAKFTFTHDCILGNRAKKFGLELQGINFSTFMQGSKVLNSSMFSMTGETNAKNRFIKDLQKDKSVARIERKADTFFLLEHQENKAAGFHNPRILFVKPVLVEKNGWEIWEIASWDREDLARFIRKVKTKMATFKLIKFVRIPIDDVYFPRLLPDLTEKQKFAIELATREGYYTTPRKTDMRTLAKIAKISLATYQEHLRRAEEKLIPHLLNYTR
jgi:predicted DNA binding protein